VEEIEALRRIHYHTRRLARAGAGEASPRTDPGS
jgi:hypothetical protein